MKLFFLALVLLLTPISHTFYATVTGVHDGDSITVINGEHQQIKVRLEGIDCPELNQAFGKKSKQLTAALCFNKQVRLVKSGKDQYGRTLAFVYIGDLCVNSELLKQGLAWHYKKYNHDPAMAKLEMYARSQKAGLWSQAAPVPPWIYRKN
jgi:micrococcal nuclease